MTTLGGRFAALNPAVGGASQFLQVDRASGAVTVIGAIGSIAHSTPSPLPDIHLGRTRTNSFGEGPGARVLSSGAVAGSLCPT